MRSITSLFREFGATYPLLILAFALFATAAHRNVRTVLTEAGAWPAFWLVPASWVGLIASLEVLCPAGAPRPDPLLVNGAIKGSLVILAAAAILLVVRAKGARVSMVGYAFGNALCWPWAMPVTSIVGVGK